MDTQIKKESGTDFLQGGVGGQNGTQDFADSHLTKTIEPDNFPLLWQPLNGDEMQTDTPSSVPPSSASAQPSFVTSNSYKKSEKESLNEDQNRNHSENEKMEERLTHKRLKNSTVSTENCIGDGEKDGDSAANISTTMKNMQRVEGRELIKTVNLSGKSLFKRKENALIKKLKNPPTTTTSENGMIGSADVDRMTDLSKMAPITEIKKEIIDDVGTVPDAKNNMEHSVPGSDKDNREEFDKGNLKVKRKRKIGKLKTQDPSNAFAISRKGSYLCWICSQKFTLCLGVKKHIVQKHSKALCAISGEPTSQAQLLLFCPKSCKYVTSELESFRQHLISCKQEIVTTAGVDFIEIQNGFVVQEYATLIDKVTSGAIFSFLEEQKKLSVTGKKRKQDLNEAPSPKQVKVDQSDKMSGDDENCQATNGDLPSAPPKKEHTVDFIRTRSTLHLCHVCNVVFMTNQSLQQHIRKEHIEEVQDNAPESEEQAEASDEDNRGGTDSYICNCCQKSFTSKNYLLSHMRIHKELTEKRAFKCDNCGKTFNRSLNLITHMRIHTGEKPFKCSECGRCFSTNSNILMHMRIHTGEKPFKCNECSKSFCRRNDLKTHMRIHTGEKPFKCNECGQSFRTNSNILNHMRTHTGERPYPCNECGKAFSRSGDLIVHKRIHTGERPFKCDECGQCYKTNWNLLLHVRTHTGEKPYKCDECGRGFLRSGELNIHKRVHTGEKPYKCSECDKDFVRSGDLQVHMRIHTENVIFKCDECDKTFTRNVDLSNHVRLHTGEKPFACEDCGRSFSRSAARNKHQKLSCHAGDKPFKCEVCGKGYTQSDQYHSHLRTHTGEKPFVCSLCDESFSQSGLLKRHIKKHAQEDEHYQCCECEETFSKSSLLDEHMKMHLEEETG